MLLVVHIAFNRPQRLCNRNERIFSQDRPEFHLKQENCYQGSWCDFLRLFQTVSLRSITRTNLGGKPSSFVRIWPAAVSRANLGSAYKQPQTRSLDLPPHAAHGFFDPFLVGGGGKEAALKFCAVDQIGVLVLVEHFDRLPHVGVDQADQPEQAGAEQPIAPRMVWRSLRMAFLRP
jgi:hypothetical protein